MKPFFKSIRNIWKGVEKVKRYIVFIVSFALFSMVFQVLSGWILTACNTPELSSMKSSLSQELNFGNTSVIHLIATLLSATLAYFLSQKILKTST